MNTLFRYIFLDKILLLACVATIGCIVCTTAVILFLFQSLPPFIPLFNQMPWGVARLGTKDQFFIPVFISFFILIINTILANVIYEKMPLISRILCITSLLIAFFVFLFTIRAAQIIL
jgi:hypothetical protein